MTDERKQQLDAYDLRRLLYNLKAAARCYRTCRDISGIKSDYEECRVHLDKVIAEADEAIGMSLSPRPEHGLDDCVCCAPDAPSRECQGIPVPEERLPSDPPWRVAADARLASLDRERQKVEDYIARHEGRLSSDPRYPCCGHCACPLSNQSPTNHLTPCRKCASDPTK